MLFHRSRVTPANMVFGILLTTKSVSHMSQTCASTWPFQTASFPLVHRLFVSPTVQHLKVSLLGPLMMVSLHLCLVMFAWLVVESLDSKTYALSRCWKMGGFNGSATRSITQPSPRMFVDARPSTIFGERAFYQDGRFVSLLQMFDIATLLTSWLSKEKKCLSSQTVQLYLASFFGEFNSQRMARSK